MKPSEMIAYAGIAAGLIIAATMAVAFLTKPAQAADDPPLMLARDGFFYVNAKTTTVDGKDYVSHQMYVEVRIPAKQTHPYPIVMVHGGTMSGTNYTGTPDGREGWAQYFVRQGFAVYVVDQPGRARSGYLAAAYGPMHNVERGNALSRFVAQEKYKLWPQAVLHTQWPGSGEPDDPATVQLAASQMPAIADFASQQFLNRDALLALLDKIGPAILLTHSQAGAFGWPVADARPDLVKAILAIEPNGPPFYQVEFKGAPDWFKQGTLALPYGITAVPLTYAPPIKDPSELKMVQQDKADTPDLVRCYAASRAGAATAQSAEDADPGAHVGGVLSRAVRSLHGELSAPGRRQADVHSARRHRHQGQQPRHDAGEEQQGDRRGAGEMAGRGAEGVIFRPRDSGGGKRIYFWQLGQ